MEPNVFRNIDCAGETRSIIDLPIEAGVENRRVLHGVRSAGLVLAEINPFGIGVVIADSKLNTEKPAAGGGSDIHINNAVAHLIVFQRRRSTIEEEGLAALIFHSPGLSFQIPAPRVRGNGEWS